MPPVRCPRCDLPLTSAEAATGVCPSCRGKVPTSAGPGRNAAPAKTSPTMGGRLGGAIMGKIGGLALLAALILGVLTYHEFVLASQSSAAPEEIKLQDLINRGLAGNAHVAVTDFVLCDNLVYIHAKENKDVWLGVWVPVVPNDEVDPAKRHSVKPRNVKALFYSPSIRSAREVESRLNKPKVPGVVTNWVVSVPDGETRLLLQESYPDTDFDKCLIIEAERSPSAWGHVLMFSAGAVAALAVAVVCFWPRWATAV